MHLPLMYEAKLRSSCIFKGLHLLSMISESIYLVQSNGDLKRCVWLALPRLKVSAKPRYRGRSKREKERKRTWKRCWPANQTQFEEKGV